MTYNDDFRDIVKTGEYIGTGNPNAKILIIGCECAIGKNSTQYEDEIKNNAHNWQVNIDSANLGVDIEITDDCSSINPLYPYRGQLLKIDNKKNCGTSRTWYNYQKLYNGIFGYEANNIINFHEKFFITEFSTITARSKEAIIANKKLKEERKSSIEKRRNLFSESAFYQKFPIVIVATGGAPYVDNKIVKLCEIFNLDDKNIVFRRIDNILCNIHRNKIGQSPKLVIHTWQFGGCISNHFLDTIAELCRNFLSEHYNEL